jgi:hypothetical protein
MQQPRIKRQQIINANETNDRRQQLEIRAYPIAISITRTILSSNQITHTAVYSHGYKNKTSTTFYLYQVLHSSPPPRAG